MQKKLLGALATTLLVSTIAAEDSISANMALATDYVWRGYSQTLENPAIQGGLDWSSESGWYVGTWGSNVDFGDAANLELDLYGGWGTELSNGVGIDLGFIQYLYYDTDADLDFNEIYAGVSYSGISATVSYDPDNKNSYIDLGYEYEFANGIGLGLHVGSYAIDEASIDDNGTELDLTDDLITFDDYTDYSITFSKSYAGLDFGLGYYDTSTDLDVEDKNTDGRVVFSVGKSF